MKTTIFTLLLIAGFSFAAQAQTDTTRVKKSKDGTANPLGERVQLGAEDIPPQLMQTLQGNEYTGWKNARFYRETKSDEYTLDMTQGDSARVYRFDKNGKRIAEPAAKKKKVAKPRDQK